MRRRQFIAGLGGAALWPLAAHAQQSERMRRIGVLINLSEGDPIALSRVAAFRERLAQLGWSEGRNVRFDYRWGAANPDLYSGYAAELVALKPDLILAMATPSVQALQRVSRSVPIVFVGIDPVGAGVVESLARPGGNATGFTAFEYSISGKWPAERAAGLRENSN